MCGPDSDLNTTKTTSKFIDLDLLEDEEYENEGLMISIKWYLNILDDKVNPNASSGKTISKTDQDLQKKLKTILEDM